MSMSHFERVNEVYPELPHMTHRQGTFIRDFIVQHDSRNVLEIGFAHGKSSAYIAAVLEDLGRGELVTIDNERARKREPNIETVLETLGLSHRVKPIFARRSHTWEMAKMIQAEPRPQFDLCYFDGGHTWDDTGFGFVLVDMLLRPGGWIIFDDLNWTFEAAMRDVPKVPAAWRKASEDERAAAGVGMVFDLLVPHMGYTDQHTVHDGWWGIARKPLDRQAAAAFRRRPSSPGIVDRLRRRIALRTRLRSLADRMNARSRSSE